MDDRSISKPLVSVIIPHLNQPESLDVCLASLDVQSLGRNRFEVIVVDNGSSSIPENITTRYTGTRLLLESQRGPGPARNSGVRGATGDILAFIDADCRAHPEWLQTAVRELCSKPEGTILGGDVRIWRDDKGAFTAIEAYEAVFGYRFKMYIEQHGYAGTGNLVVRRADFEKIGPFAGIQFAEDIEWGQRARAAGCTFRYVPDMIVFHPARRSLPELYAKWDRHTQHFYNVAQNNRGWRIRWIARAFALLISPIVDVLKILSSDRIQGVSARFKATLVLVMVRVHRARKMVSLFWTSGGLEWNLDKKDL